MSSDESTDAFSAGKTDVAHICVNVLIFYDVVIQLRTKIIKKRFHRPSNIFIELVVLLLSFGLATISTFSG